MRGDDFVGGAGAPGRAARTSAPFAALAARGEFAGYVRTARGQDVFVSVKLGPDAAQKPPIVMLDGVAARYERNTTFEDLVKATGQSIISIYLPGQGETLAQDMRNGGRSIQRDIQQEEQARTVVEVLDALGVTAPVGVAGLSYGGAIAAQVERDYPNRFSKVMLVAPYVRSEGKASPWYNVLNNPWNPMGQAWYREAARATLQRTFNYVPEVLRPYPGAFHEGLFRLSMGLEDFELDQTVRNMEDVHFLVVPQDGASPPEENAKAFRGARSGSFSIAPDEDAGKHDLVRGNGPLVARWIHNVMSGRTPSQPQG